MHVKHPSSPGKKRVVINDSLVWYISGSYCNCCILCKVYFFIVPLLHVVNECFITCTTFASVLNDQSMAL